MPPRSLNWQSKLILLLVVPWTALSLLFQVQWFFAHGPNMVLWSLGISAALGLLALATRAGTPAAAATGALLTASMMLGVADASFQPWRSAIVPVLAFMVITSLATRYGRDRKQRLGTAEDKHGRVAAQVAANLGVATLAFDPWLHVWLINSGLFYTRGIAPMPIVAPALAALAEAAADTVSSEIGQVLGGRPFMLTTFRRVDPGTDGAISLAGTLAGILAAAAVAASGAWALHGSVRVFLLSWIGGIFGLFFDSLLGATVERARWLNNDAVNFLSTASAAVFTLVLMAATPHHAITDF
ncbi:DUF92 domain-containing protein [Occallatibacter riparius]|uniref:DUF92 domain-containing protein n=1 Tax=Occallatibacter riparius TaxID=1002689 RepID=A0A9J7BN26_9BACT|nr:DUF92 domain-containing protein [Occallatibacter riparius]UWZ83162.1 DUF92 domain-containing protein [Occallatibacter riparius]